ncbi:hypothetical protein [Streptomyces albofaciens]|uniref:hypothetical protein n=1 Tax=Streptomyces albofaciens TaxID=66866 RepID=UPI000A4C80E0|nr:hypothetical protein [Streptomyces albofaciens]
MTHHVVELLLTKPVTHRELRPACRTLPLGTNSDRTRLMTVHPAKTPGRALKSVRRRLQHVSPLDVLTTHYPSPSGQVILNVELGPAVRALIGQAAAARGERPAEYVGHSVTTPCAGEKTIACEHWQRRLRGFSLTTVRKRCWPAQPAPCFTATHASARRPVHVLAFI